MASFVQTNVNLWLAEFDLSADFNAVALAIGAETMDDTVYGDAVRSSAGGLLTARLEGEGYWDSTLDSRLFAKVGVEDTIVSVAPVDGSEGSPAFSMKMTAGEYSPMAGSELGSMLAFRITGESRGTRVISGTIMANKTSVSATGTGTSRQLGAVASTKRIYSAVHLLALTGTSIDFTVTSDDNSGHTSETTRLTHPQMTAVGSNWQDAAGAITDDWWRLKYTIVGSSFNFVGVIGIG